MKIRRIAALKTADEFQKYLRENNIALPFAEKTAALNTPYQLKRQNHRQPLRYTPDGRLGLHT